MREMMTTLLIDDDIAFRQAFRDGLLALLPDLNIEEAADGRIARTMIGRYRPDLIIVDLKMPRENGFRLTRWVKNMHPCTKVIILSAYCTPTHLVAAAEAGADCFVAKGSLSLVEIVELMRELTADQ